MRAGETVDVEIERAVAGGRMLARVDGRIVLVAGAIPGERVRARVERVTRSVAFASVVDVVDPSGDRRVPEADPACGGADYAHVKYERQGALKAEVIADAFRRLGKTVLPGPVDVVPSPERGYRLRTRLHVRQGRFGFFREGTHDLCDAGSTGQALDGTIDGAAGVLAALDDRRAELEALVVAENVPATERVVHVEPRPGARLEGLARRLALPPGVTGITAGGAQRTLLAGVATVTDTAGSLFGGEPPVSRLTAWSRHATSFFQGNRHLVGPLARHVLDVAPPGTFVDLYAGVGLFGVTLAARGDRGLAVESERSSADDLSANAAAYRETLRVMRAPVEEAVDVELDPPPGVVVLDPPRTGMSPAALRGVINWRPRRVVYVSCDPPTLARDAKGLIEAGYELSLVRAFDLFPNTAHVETVAVFDGPSG